MSQLQPRDGSQVSNDHPYSAAAIPGDQLTADHRQHQQQLYPSGLSSTYDLGSQRFNNQQPQNIADVRRHTQHKPDSQLSASGTQNTAFPGPTAIAGFDRGKTPSFPRPPGSNSSISSRLITYESQAGRGQPSSPREKLDKLLALEGYHYTSQPSTVLEEGKNVENSASLEESAHAPSNPQLTESNHNHPAQTGTVSPPSSSTMPPSSSQQAEFRPIPRNSSIDSAVSSISSQASTHHKADSAPASPAEIANLISTAGSAEAVIQYLLKEKHSSAAQNTQLWRLVDKQRSMILGLNKDLERALKDKERYRKKLKEHLSQVSPLPASNSQAALSAGRANSESPAPADPAPRERAKDIISQAFGGPDFSNPQKEHGGHDRSPTDSAHNITPSTNSTTTAPESLNTPTEPSHQNPSPSENPFGGQDSTRAPPPTTGSRGKQTANKIEQELVGTDARSTNSSDISQQTVQAPSSRSFTTRLSESSQTSPLIPLISTSAPSPLIEREERIPQPPRKAPPAPLHLTQPHHKSSHLHYSTTNHEHSESDYDDTLEANEVPVFGRGRRKTREEDDREREIAAMKEQENRSRSKKKAEKAKKAAAEPPRPQSHSPEGQPKPHEVKVLSLPSSPKHMIPLSPGGMHMRHLSPPDSLAAILGQSSPLASPSIASHRFASPPLASPGLPRSPRPSDRPLVSPTPRMPREGANIGTMASPPLSPGMGFPGLPLSPRDTKAPTPYLPNTPMSVASPGLPSSHVLPLSSPQPLFADQNGPTETARYNEPSTPSENSSQISVIGGSDSSRSVAAYQGLVSEQYPGLLLPPNALPLIDVRVCSSRMRPSRASIIAGKTKPSIEDVFTLGVFSRSDNKELWRVAKDMMSLPNLDAQLRQASNFKAKIPDRSLFTGHAPARIDARRDAVNEYFGVMINTSLKEDIAIAICQFLSTDVVDPLTENNFRDSMLGSSNNTGPKGRPKKEGYLTKKGKNFGGWKARFFIIDDQLLKYYESLGGAHIGSIKLQNAKIGKQSQSRSEQSLPDGDSEDSENQYRHAFLILEPKRRDKTSFTRHVLCAESDAERDEWVHTLLQYVDCHSSEDERPKQGLSRKDSPSGRTSGMQSKQKRYGPGKRDEKHRDSTPVRKEERPKDSLQAGRTKDHLDVGDSMNTLRGVSYEDTVPGGAPTYGPTASQRQADTPSPPIPASLSNKQISGPTNGTRIQDVESWGNKPRVPPDDPKPKKRSIWGFRGRSSSDLATPTQHPSGSSSSLAQQQPVDRVATRAVFGVPLAEAVEHNRPIGVDVFLPAVVYRCIEYLDAKEATKEEGIFRLSGSNVVIKGLRDRFNNEGDLNFLAENQYYDVHAVASLLKLYLRELPSTVLTRELHLDFLRVLEIDDKNMKIVALNTLVHQLPRANWSLLKTLSAFLIDIVNNSDVNKMTVRNVGIVFSPTLNIPAPVFSMFLQEYDGIFGADLDEKVPSPKELTASAHTLSPEDIRSPRRQMFSELPTPSYRQDTFSTIPDPLQHPAHNPRQVDTGFIPLRPSYDQLQHLMQAHGGSLNGAMANDASKSRRRESSMFLVAGVQKKGSATRLNENRGMVGDNSAFE